MDSIPWYVAIISTDHDLKDLRSTMAAWLNDHKFGVLAFEKPGFPVKPGVHSHEACVAALSQADIVILVIDKRYGGLFLGQGHQSITEMEYERVYQEGKIVIPCVRYEAWQDRFEMFKSADQLQKQNMDPRKTLHPNYVDKWETLDFIEKVHRADADNFLIIFKNADDLSQQIEGRLRGLSRYILQRVVDSQANYVKNLKTTTGMAFSLGDVLERGFFVEPPFKMKSGALVKASEIGLYLQTTNNNAAILGQPGSGKSTLLGKAFLDTAVKLSASDLTKMPFFISLRGLGAGFKFDMTSYFKECFERFLRKSMYPLLMLDTIQPIFFVDGLDEMTEDAASIDIQALSQSQILDHQFVLSCRSRFATEYVNVVNLGNKLSVIVELQPWSENTVKEYISAFCKMRHRIDLVDDIARAFSSSLNNDEVSTNPLLLTLFLWVVEESGMTLPLNVKSKTSLFDITLDLWANREYSRSYQNGKSDASDTISSLVKAWQIAAWEIYCSRFDKGQPLSLMKLLETVGLHSAKLKSICKQEAFECLVEVRPYSNEVHGMIHEQLLEHLVAKALVEGMQNCSFPFPLSLKYVIRHEINLIVRALWRDMDNIKKIETLNNLAKAFDKVAGHNDIDSLLIRNQATYYIGRLNIPEATQKLREIDASENNLVVKLSVSFGLISYGSFDVEERFLSHLKTEPDWDQANRGYHLVYYHDWQVSTSKPPYYDPGNIPWRNTLRSLVRHITNESLRYVALRRIELFTIKRFIETRKTKDLLDSNIMDRLEKALTNIPVDIVKDVPEGFHEKVMEEYMVLKKYWMTLA
jgi:hypothetical protein